MEDIVKFLKYSWDEAMSDPKTIFYTVDHKKVILSRRQKRKFRKAKVKLESHSETKILTDTHIVAVWGSLKEPTMALSHDMSGYKGFLPLRDIMLYIES